MAKLKYYQYDFKAMGSPCAIQLYARSQKKGQDAAKLAIEDGERVVHVRCHIGEAVLSLVSDITHAA